MKRFLQLAVIATAGGVLGMASPAIAHEEITPSTFPTGKPTFLTLSAANEKTSDLTRVAIAAPAGVPFGTTTRQPAGWTVEKSDTQIAWSGGKVAPDNFEQWGFEIEGADQPGALQYKVTMGFADGASDDVEVDVTAVAAGTPDTTVTPSTPSTASTGSSPTTTAATTAPRATSSDSADGLAVAALIVGLLAGILAGVALVVTIRARRGVTTGNPAPGPRGEDW